MISIGEEAFMEDELNAYRWPGRFDYPQDYHRTQVHRNRSAFADEGTHAVVCVADDADVDLASPETILGLAYWWRQPAGKLSGNGPFSATSDAPDAHKNASKDMSRNRGILAIVERFLLRVDAAYRGLAYPDRSVCTKEAGDALAAEFIALDPFARLPSHFHCN